MNTAVIDRKQPQQKRGFAKQKLILDICKDIIRESDVNSLKMNAVAQRAGISIGSLYQYFPTKSAIVATLAEELLAVYRELNTKQFALVDTIEDFTEQMYQSYVRGYNYYRKHPLIHEVYVGTVADSAVRHLIEEEARHYSEEMFNLTRKVGVDMPEAELRRKCRILDMMGYQVLAYTHTMKRKEALEFLRDTADLNLLGLGLTTLPR